MTLLIIWFTKLFTALLRLLRGGGSALPGLIVERVYPRILAKQLDKLPEGVVVVTGTNGKTTTTKALVYLLEQCGRTVLTNPTGSNFTRGIYATVAQKSSLNGDLDYDLAVFEIDEAYSRVFAKLYPPRYVLALNVMRDQLDRYGEIDTTAQMIGDTISAATDGVILNFDDPRIAALAEKTDTDVHYFSIDSKLKKYIPNDDDLHGRKKRHKKSRKNRSSRVTTLVEYNDGKAAFAVADRTYRAHVQVAGLHNALNITAAVAAASAVCPDVEPHFLIPTISGITSAFGRGEILRLGDKQITLALVKNPSGFQQSLRSYQHESFDAIGFVINDQFADGRDVSWLWDVDFSSVSSKTELFTGGMRAADMTLRLEYAGKTVVNESQDILEFLASFTDTTEKHSIIYCTYTAMLEIRKQLAKQDKTAEDIWRR